MELSEQNIVDCSDEFKNYGCRGGLPYRAFKYMRDYGIQSSTSYPYRGKVQSKSYFPLFMQLNVGDNYHLSF